MFCEKVVPIVNGFAKEYDGKMKFVVRDAKNQASAALIEKYGLNIHGMVITDDKGELLWSESGHKQKKEVVKAEIDKLLGE